MHSDFQLKNFFLFRDKWKFQSVFQEITEWFGFLLSVESSELQSDVQSKTDIWVQNPDILER